VLRPIVSFWEEFSFFGKIASGYSGLVGSQLFKSGMLNSRYSPSPDCRVDVVTSTRTYFVGIIQNFFSSHHGIPGIFFFYSLCISKYFYIHYVRKWGEPNSRRKKKPNFPNQIPSRWASVRTYFARAIGRDAVLT